MTLVIGLQHPDWLVMASDRMLSDGRGRSVKRAAVKLVYYYGDMIFGYTGAAELFDETGRCLNTSEWLARTLCRVPRRSVCDAIAEIELRATEAMARTVRANSSYRGTPLTFLGLGWIRDFATGTSESIRTKIGNDIDSNGNLLASVASKFTSVIWRDDVNVEDGQIHIRTASVGQRAIPAEGILALEHVEKIAKGEVDGWEMVQGFVDLIRTVSTRLKGRIVGKNVLVGVLTRQNPPIDRTGIFGPQSDLSIYGSTGDFSQLYEDGNPNAFHFHYADGRQDQAFEMPHLVCPGQSQIGYHGQNLEKFVHIKANLRGLQDPMGNLAGCLTPHLTNFGRMNRAESNRRRTRKRKR